MDINSSNLVLVAEDDAVIRLVIVRQLSQMGYIGHTAENGAEAVIMASKIPYSIIFMDVQMPKLNGIDATIAIRKAERMRIPIIALTGTADRNTCVEAGMDDFMEKPITQDKLAHMISKWSKPLTTQSGPRAS